MENKIETCHHCGEEKENCYHGYIAMCIPIPEAEGKKEKWNLIDAYRKYCTEWAKYPSEGTFSPNEYSSPTEYEAIRFTQEQFNNKVKTDSEFSKKWSTKDWWNQLERTDITPEESKELDDLSTYDQLLNTVGRGVQCDDCVRKEAELYEKYYPKDLQN